MCLNVDRGYFFTVILSSIKTTVIAILGLPAKKSGTCDNMYADQIAVSKRFFARLSILMDSQRVHQTGCTRSVHPGVGVEPGGFTSLLRQAQDGEPVEPPAGDHANGVTAS